MGVLHNEYKGKVTIIGMNIWQKDPENVAPFVEKMGEKMPYSIATDVVPEGEEANKGKMAQTWMVTAGQNGIPAVFIVDGKARIAWIGHPSDMDEPLQSIVNGEWNLESSAKEHKIRMEKVAMTQPIQGRLYTAMEEKNWDVAIDACDELLKIDSEEFASSALFKFQILLQEKQDTEAAYAYGRSIVDGTLSDKSWGLNGVAWIIVDPDFETSDRDFELALKAAKQADKLTESKNPQIMDTLARVHFSKGDVEKAIEIQSRAVELVDEGEKADYQKALEEYEKAATD